MKNNNLGIIEPQYYTFAYPPNRFILEYGERLGPITVCYETYGELNKDKSNAILILHTFSGDAHAAGFYEGDSNFGRWDSMIGPGKAFDTDKYFVICSNIIGGCNGSTGPSSINPETNRHYGLDFPVITIKDIIGVQKELVTYLGIKKLLSISGGSMGGSQVLQWIASFPDMVYSAIPIATSLNHSPQQIAFNEVGRQAIMADPDWHGGDYYNKPKQPQRGLALARMIGHITYMSDQSMKDKFSRKITQKKSRSKFTEEFEVESYLRNRGDNFVKRFDANSYLYITKAMDYFDLSNGNFIPENKHIDTQFLVIAFKSDWLYPAYQSQEIVRVLKRCGAKTVYCEISSTYGHDAFLLEVDEQTRLIKHFLEKNTKT